MLFRLNPKNEKVMQKKIKIKSPNKENYFYKTCHQNNLLQTASSAAGKEAETFSHNQNFISVIACYHVSVKVTSHHFFFL